MKPVHQQCRDRRRELGLTLDDISMAWDNADIGAISRWERGKRTALPGKRTASDYKALLDHIATEHPAAVTR